MLHANRDHDDNDEHGKLHRGHAEKQVDVDRFEIPGMGREQATGDNRQGNSPPAICRIFLNMVCAVRNGSRPQFIPGRTKPVSTATGAWQTYCLNIATPQTTHAVPIRPWKGQNHEQNFG